MSERCHGMSRKACLALPSSSSQSTRKRNRGPVRYTDALNWITLLGSTSRGALAEELIIPVSPSPGDAPELSCSGGWALSTTLRAIRMPTFLTKYSCGRFCRDSISHDASSAGANLFTKSLESSSARADRSSAPTAASRASSAKRLAFTAPNACHHATIAEATVAAIKAKFTIRFASFMPRTLSAVTS